MGVRVDETPSAHVFLHKVQCAQPEPRVSGQRRRARRGGGGGNDGRLPRPGEVFLEDTALGSGSGMRSNRNPASLLAS